MHVLLRVYLGCQTGYLYSSLANWSNLSSAVVSSCSCSAEHNMLPNHQGPSFRKLGEVSSLPDRCCQSRRVPQSGHCGGYLSNSHGLKKFIVYGTDIQPIDLILDYYHFIHSGWSSSPAFSYCKLYETLLRFHVWLSSNRPEPTRYPRLGRDKARLRRSPTMEELVSSNRYRRLP